MTSCGRFEHCNLLEGCTCAKWTIDINIQASAVEENTGRTIRGSWCGGTRLIIIVDVHLFIVLVRDLLALHTHIRFFCLTYTLRRRSVGEVWWDEARVLAAQGRMRFALGICDTLRDDVA